MKLNTMEAKGDWRTFPSVAFKTKAGLCYLFKQLLKEPKLRGSRRLKEGMLMERRKESGCCSAGEMSKRFSGFMGQEGQKWVQDYQETQVGGSQDLREKETTGQSAWKSKPFSLWRQHPFVCGAGQEIKKLIQAGLAKRLKHEAELLAQCWADK